MLAVIVSSLDQNIVSVAMPHIAGELGGISDISWIVTAFLLTSTISAPIYGKLSDMHGRRRLFTASMSIFLVASLLCSLVATMPQLIVARALQGLGAGGLVTLSQGAIGELVGPRQRGRIQGYFSGALAISTVAGPLVGGALISFQSWRWIFVVTLPVGLLSALLIRRGLPLKQSVRQHQIDYAGVVLLALGTSAALLLADSLADAARHPVLVGGTLAATVIFIPLFVSRQKRAAEPLVDPQLFGNASFVVGVVAAGMMTFAMQGALVFLPLYFQIVQGQTPTHSGLMLTAQIAGTIFSSIVGGQLSARTGHFKRYFIAGISMEATALVLLTFSALFNLGQPSFIAALVILGLGTGLGMPNAVVVIQNAVSPERLGIATASMSFIRSLGSAVGVAMSGCVMQFTLHALSGSAKGVPGASAGLASPDSLRLAICSSFALGAVMMLAVLTTLSLKLPAQRAS